MYLHLLPVWALFMPVCIVGIIAFFLGLLVVADQGRTRWIVAGVMLAIIAVVTVIGAGIVAFGNNSAHNTRELQTQARATYGVHLTTGDINFLLAGYSTTITISSTRNGNTVTDRNQLAKLGHQGDRTTLIVSGPVSRDVHPVDENAHELPR